MEVLIQRSVGVVRCFAYRCAGSVPLALLLIGVVTAGAGTPRVTTHQTYVEEVSRSADFDITDIKAVFALVINSLPDHVKVYPTENYFYFKFHHRGVPYAGNIRLENELRDQGKVHFAYSPEPADWRREEKGFHLMLDRTHGVEVEKIDALTYRISYAGKPVVFALNDLRSVAPPPGMLTADERYIGPVFDESAIRFFLVYNAKVKIFHYLLDETVAVPETFTSSRTSPHILIGRRTGFAFYRDKYGRKILIGVFEPNARINNYFDGPFDQLPDNFIEGESLRSAILEVAPHLKGRIDRFGSSFNGENRYMIAPYLHYINESELAVFHRCASNKNIRAELYPACFAIEEESPRRAPVTAAQGKQRKQRAGR